MCSFGFISALFSQQSPSVWSSPGTRSVEGEQDWVPIYPARTSLRKRQSHGFHFYTEEQHAHWCLVSGKKEGGRKRRRQASDKKKKKKRDKKQQTKNKPKTKNPFKTVKTQFNHQQQKSSCQHYIIWPSQTELPTSGGQKGTQGRAEDAEHPETGGAQYRVRGGVAVGVLENQGVKMKVRCKEDVANTK